MVSAIMALMRDGSIYTSDFKAVPNYHVITRESYDHVKTDQRSIEARLRSIVREHDVFAIWTAPMDESRYEIPPRIQQLAAQAGIRIQV